MHAGSWHGIQSRTSLAVLGGDVMVSNEHGRGRARRRVGARGPLHALGEIVGRSFFPLAALAIILGTPLWGGWGTLLLAVLCWSIVMRYA